MNLANELDYHFEAHNIRVVIDEKNKPWFVAKDVADVLGYTNTTQAIIKHCKGSIEMRLPSAGGLQMSKLIGRDDIIRLVMKSKLPSAQKFEEWAVGVIEKVLETGSYNLEEELIKKSQDKRYIASLLLKAAENEDKLLELELKLQVVNHEIEVKDRALTEALPMIKYHEAVLSAEGTFSTTDMAQELKTTPQALHKKLNKAEVIYKRGKNWYLYESFKDTDIAKSIVRMHRSSDGLKELTSRQLRWTTKGQKFIHALFNKDLAIGSKAIRALLPPPDLKLPS
jgi:anti-repressor protein